MNAAVNRRTTLKAIAFTILVGPTALQLSGTTRWLAGGRWSGRCASTVLRFPGRRRSCVATRASSACTVTDDGVACTQTVCPISVHGTEYRPPWNSTWLSLWTFACFQTTRS